MGNRRKELDARLADYATGAGLATAATTLRGRLGNWPIYAAAVGSALAMSTNASASIIEGTISGAIVSPTGVNKSSIKGLLFLGEVNLKASSGVLTSSGHPLGPFAALNVSGIGPTAFVFATNLQQQAINFAPGAVISAGAGSPDQNANIVAATFSHLKYGQFASGVPGYVGLAFSLGGGHFDYGWLEVEFQNGQNGAPQTLEALAFGVNTAQDQAIMAGTPEPGSMGLALLATGAFGVAALRRRKKQFQTEATV